MFCFVRLMGEGERMKAVRELGDGNFSGLSLS